MYVVIEQDNDLLMNVWEGISYGQVSDSSGSAGEFGRLTLGTAQQ